MSEKEPAIWPLEPPNELVQITRFALRQIEELMYARDDELDRNTVHRLYDLLLKIFTDYDRYRTEQIEMLKRQLTDCISLQIRPTVLRKPEGPTGD